MIEDLGVITEVIEGGEDRVFTKVKRLGQGGFAEAWEVTHEGNHYALKCIGKKTLEKVNSAVKTKLRWEMTIHTNTDHDNIVEMKHQFEDKTHIYILMELCEK